MYTSLSITQCSVHRPREYLTCPSPGSAQVIASQHHPPTVLYGQAMICLHTGLYSCTITVEVSSSAGSTFVPSYLRTRVYPHACTFAPWLRHSGCLPLSFASRIIFAPCREFSLRYLPTQFHRSLYMATMYLRLAVYFDEHKLVTPTMYSSHPLPSLTSPKHSRRSSSPARQEDIHKAAPSPSTRCQFPGLPFYPPDQR